MQVIPLSAIPNQTFSTTTPDGTRYDFAVYLCNGSMCYDIAINEVQTVTGERILNGEFLLPFAGLQGLLGNFMLLTANYALPDYAQFGTTQTLIYMTYAEQQAALVAPVQPVEPPYAVAA